MDNKILLCNNSEFIELKRLKQRSKTQQSNRLTILSKFKLITTIILSLMSSKKLLATVTVAVSTAATCYSILTWDIVYSQKQLLDFALQALIEVYSTRQ
jgi:hypothetical protein